MNWKHKTSSYQTNTYLYCWTKLFLTYLLFFLWLNLPNCFGPMFSTELLLILCQHCWVHVRAVYFETYRCSWSTFTVHQALSEHLTFRDVLIFDLNCPSTGPFMIIWVKFFFEVFPWLTLMVVIRMILDIVQISMSWAVSWTYNCLLTTKLRMLTFVINSFISFPTIVTVNAGLY